MIDTNELRSSVNECRKAALVIVPMLDEMLEDGELEARDKLRFQALSSQLIVLSHGNLLGRFLVGMVERMDRQLELQEELVQLEREGAERGKTSQALLKKSMDEVSEASRRSSDFVDGMERELGKPYVVSNSHTDSKERL